jgi:hypothetical protein
LDLRIVRPWAVFRSAGLIYALRWRFADRIVFIGCPDLIAPRQLRWIKVPFKIDLVPSIALLLDPITAD